MLRAVDREIRAVTFDCWGTLLTYEPAGGRSHALRVEALRHAIVAGGHACTPAQVAQRLEAAHRQHLDAWEEALDTGATDIARWALEPLGIRDPEIVASCVHALEEAALSVDVPPLEGAPDTLRALAERGVGLALVCDTGFTPGRVVRQLLDRAGLLEWLDVQVFSNEAGMTKPHPPVFESALDGLGVGAEHTVHVGDLRRTDVGGARNVGMGTIRIRDFNDDDSDLPDADAVADSHAHLREILGV